MATATIDLQDGFQEDTVVIRVNQHVVAQREQVTTDYSIGFAARVEVPISTDPAALEVSLPGKQLSEQIVLQRATDIHVGVSVLGGVIRYRLSEVPFEYY